MVNNYRGASDQPKAGFVPNEDVRRQRRERRRRRQEAEAAKKNKERASAPRTQHLNSTGMSEGSLGLPVPSDSLDDNNKQQLNVGEFNNNRKKISLLHRKEPRERIVSL